MPRAVILVVDGLGAKHLGPYGNTWIETPALNHLAAESLVLNNVCIPFANPWKSLDAMWRGATALGPSLPALKDQNLLSWLASKNTVTQLLTDDPDLTDQQLVAQFTHQTDIDPAGGIRLADEWDETHTASFFAQAVSAIEQLSENSMLWLHTRGLGNPWDAPYEYRSRFADEEDPEPSGSAQVPNLQLDPDYDPDTLHEIQCGMAGQVTLIDRCVGVLLQVLQDAPDDILFVLTSLRGFPLGEHLTVGWHEVPLYHELMHVPAIVRYPRGEHSMRRWQGIGELRDLTEIICQWFCNQNMIAEPERQFSLCRSAEEVVLRTPAWQLRFAESIADELSPANLFLKPDDQNEVNDVASRCDEVVQAGRLYLQGLQHPGESQPAIPEILLQSES